MTLYLSDDSIQPLLSAVKLALRIKTTNAYDEELKIYIQTCLYDLQRLNIDFDPEAPEPEIKTLVIVYVKSKFGSNDINFKIAMEKAYRDLRLAVFLDGGHKKVKS